MVAKPLTNNRPLNVANIFGRVVEHDIFLDQGVLQDSSPTFANLSITSDLSVGGNLYVEGNMAILNTNIVEFKDNIILVNNQETGLGVLLGQAGLEVERGSLENYRIVWNETNQRTEVGVISNLQPIAIRESNPLPNGLMTWDATQNLIVATNQINIPIIFNSTVNSTSTTTGAIVINSLGISQDTFIGGRIRLVGNALPNYSTIYTDPGTNSLNIISPQNINLTPSQNIFIPYNVRLQFGNIGNSISASGNTDEFNIRCNANINFIPQTGFALTVPNQIPITFSTQNEKVYTDSSNNMCVAGSQDIHLLPNNGNAAGKKVLIPVDTPLAFYNINQTILSNISGDLSINAGNNILLNPGPTLNVKIPTDNGIVFGGGGLQRITADSNNDLRILSSSDIYLTTLSSGHVNLPTNIPLTFRNYSQYILGDSNGNLIFSAQTQLKSLSQVYISNTTNSTTATNGSIHTDGGLGVAKTIISEQSIIVNSDNQKALYIQNTGGIGDIFTVDSTNSGRVNIYSGDGTKTNPSLEINETSSLFSGAALIQLKTAFDSTNGYMLGRGLLSVNGGRVFTANIPSYTDYSSLGNIPKFSITTNDCSTELFSIQTDTGNIFTLGTLGLINSNNSFSIGTGAITTLGGIGIGKNLYVGGDLRLTPTSDSTSLINIKNQSNQTLFNINSVGDYTTINTNLLLSKLSSDAFTINNETLTVFNIDTQNNILSTTLKIQSSNNTNSTDTSSGSIVLTGGMAIQKSLNVGGNSSFASGINMINTKITNLADPTNPQDAATMNYVNLIKQGLYVKDSVMCATTQAQNINTDFTPTSVIDGYTLQLNDRILLLYQANPQENGIYIVTNSTPTRSTDFQSGSSAGGTFTFVKQGTINTALGFICNTYPPNDIIDTDGLNYTQFTGLGQIQAGSALSKNFNQINVNVDNISIEIETLSDSLRIKNTAVSTGLTGGSGTPLETTPDQSHVTKLGTITTGVWNGSVIQVPYGGTGKTSIPVGQILFGNNNSPINTSSKLFYDSTNTRLGLGTNSPTSDLNIKSTNTITISLDADADANNLNAKPEIKLSYSGTNSSHIGMTRNYDEYANNTYPDAIIISNDQTDSTSIIQLCTYQQSRMTILSNGNIGINTTIPNSSLTINGTFFVNGNSQFTSNTISLNSSTGSAVFSGGISVNCNQNSSSVDNGGAISVLGGASIKKDLYVGGSIYAINTPSNTFSYITITATDEAVNLTTGSFLTFGGITIQAASDATSVTSGGGLLSLGGAAIGLSLYVGSTIYGTKDAYLGNLYFTTDSVANNYIESPNNNRTVNSFLPINFTQYNNTASNSVTIHDNGLVLNKNAIIQIGGTLPSPDGYQINYTIGNLNIKPQTSNYNLNIGTIGNYSNLNIYGNGNGQIVWKSTSSTLLLTNTTLQLNKVNSTGSINLTTPDTSSISYLQASGANMTLNIGSGSISGQLTTILSNNLGDSTITFTPSNTTSSSLILTNNVYSTFNGPITLSDRTEYSGNALHQTINNTNGNSMWIYMGQISTGGPESGYCEIDLNNGVNTTSSNDISGLKLIVAINGTSCIASHQHYGNIPFNSTQKPICHIYNDEGLPSSYYHLFILLSGNSQTNINVTTQRNTKFLARSEGISTVPNGTFSTYTGAWTTTYSSNIESTLKYTIGDLTVQGNSLKIADNLPIIGYNNNLTTNSRDIGILYQRYQIPNDSGLGDIVNNESPLFIDSIPNQSLIPNLFQIKFSNLANSSDDYYINWWIKIDSGTNTNQVRQITAYNGAQRVATLSTPLTTQNPSSGDTVNFYNNAYISNYFDTQNDTFSLAYTNIDPGQSFINVNDYADLTLRALFSTATVVSTNSSSGSIRLLGGISISNTSDAVSSTLGGTLSSAGGIAIRKNLIVGNNIGLGTSGFTPQETIHIRKTTATQRLESDTSSYSYLDFVENGTSNRYGILFDNTPDLFSLTYSNSSTNPYNSNKALTINSNGYIGINTTTNINSPLTMNVNTFISTNATTGFLGLIGANTNTNDNSLAARILLDNNSTGGNVRIYAGNNTVGNVSLYSSVGGIDTEGLRLDHNGIVHVYSTQISNSSTSGALVVTGGISILCSENATSLTSGGALTVDGGASIEKNLYIGGNLYLTGTVTAQGAVTSPVITYPTFTNCSFVEDYNVTLIANGNNGTLTFALVVTPNTVSSNCEIILTLPSRSNAFTKRFEVISSVSGYTDETNITPLYNILGCGIVGTNRLLIKFQSVSTNTHTLQIQCTYVLA